MIRIDRPRANLEARVHVYFHQEPAVDLCSSARRILGFDNQRVEARSKLPVVKV